MHRPKARPGSKRRNKHLADALTYPSCVTVFLWQLNPTLPYLIPAVTVYVIVHGLVYALWLQSSMCQRRPVGG